MLISPQPIPTDKAVNYNLTRDTRWLEINNDSPYHLCFRFDEALLYFDYEHVDYVCKPYTSQTLNLTQPINELSCFADADFGISGNPSGRAGRWWFQSSQWPLSTSPASYGAVGFSEKQEVVADVGPLEVTRINNDDAAGAVSILTARFLDEATDRIQIRNDGRMTLGNGVGSLAVFVQWANNTPQIGATVTTQDPQNPLEVANKKYVDSALRLVQTFDSATRTANAGATPTLTHASGKIPDLIVGYWRPSGSTDGWDILSGFASNSNVPIIQFITADTLRVNNGRTAAINYIVRTYKFV